MKKYKILSVAFAALISIQNAKSQSVSYKIIENDPDKRNLFIHLNPFNAQAYMSDITIGYNVQANWITDHFQVQADFRKAYLDANATGVFSPIGLTKASQFEVGGIFNFTSRLKDVSNKVVLSSSSYGRYTYSKYIMVNAEARRITGVRGGFLSFFANHKVDNDITKVFTDNDIKGKGSDGQTRYLRDTINFETINYTARSTGLYAGLDYKVIRHVRIDPDGYSTRANKAYNNFYADVLFTPLVVYDLKPNERQAAFNGVDINIKDNKRKLIGWRVGWQWMYNQGFGFNTKMEIGSQPGAYDKSFFMTLGFGFTIGTKAKLNGKSEAKS